MLAWDMAAPPDSALEAEIGDCLAQFPEVAVAYLFGSRASGRARTTSDVDVAVSFATHTDEALRAERMLDILAALSQCLGPLGERVDLLDLGRAGSAVAFRVIRDGHRILVRDPGHRVRLEAQIARRYDDERPYRERFRSAAVNIGRDLERDDHG